MAQMITLDSPNRLDYLSRFVDQYTASRKADEERKLREQQIANQQTMAARQGEHWTALEGFQKQQVANDTTRVGNETTEAATADRIKRGVAVVSEVQRLKEVGDIPGAQKVLSAALQQDPELGKLNLNFMLAGGETANDRASANTAKFAETQTGIAANSGTDPNAVNFTTKRATGAFMPPEGFTQQQASNLQARRGGSTGSIPKPTGDAVTDYERRATGAMPTAAQNQTADTTIKTTGMQVAGADRRQRIATDAAVGGMNRSQLQSAIDRVSDDYRQDPITKQFTTSATGYEFLKAIKTNTNNPADDIGMIYAFAKIMDPESVVREGEYATVQKYAQAWAETFGFNAKRIFSNEKFLTSQALANMKATAATKFGAVAQAHKQAKTTYDKRITDLRSGKVAGGLPEYTQDAGSQDDPLGLFKK